MYTFTTETQGLDTFRVCELSIETQLDTPGLGMLLNNKIAGLCPVSSIQMDNKRFIRYNISSQIPLQQFFADKVDKRRFLTVLHNILSAMESIEDYMLDPGMLLMEKEEIYVNVGTFQTDLIYYPVVEERKEFDIYTFVKNLIMSTEFDTHEQDNYVTLLISYLNHTEQLSITELKNYISTLMQEAVAQEQVAVPVMQRQETVVSAAIYQGMAQEAYGIEETEIPQNMVQAQDNTEFAVPELGTVQKTEKKGFLFKLDFLSKKEKSKEKAKEKIKPKKEKPIRAEKIKDIELLPEPPKPAGVPIIPQPQPAASMLAIPQQPVQVTPIVKQQPVSSMPVMQPQPTLQAYTGTSNYGETVVLGADTNGATTVLSAGYNTMQKQRNPYLLRKKTNEKVEINKNIFRIGKERSYVDYCIADNSAVSRSHADIIRKNNEFYIVDNNSLNHTFLNGMQIPSSQMQKLEDYMVIKLADEVFEFTL